LTPAAVNQSLACYECRKGRDDAGNEMAAASAAEQRLAVLPRLLA
jgi:hypothetical protein